MPGEVELILLGGDSSDPPPPIPRPSLDGTLSQSDLCHVQFLPGGGGVGRELQGERGLLVGLQPRPPITRVSWEGSCTRVIASSRGWK